MIQKTSVTEKALLYRLQCPLRADGANSGTESPVLHCAEHTYDWLIDEIAAGRQPTAGETREFFNTEWQQTSYFHSRYDVSLEQYNRSLLEGVHACARLRDLIWPHEILQPVTKYELPVDGITITGEYAVLRSSRRKTHALIPYLCFGGKQKGPIIPDIVTFARWVDIMDRLADQEWRVDRIRVMYYGVAQNLKAEYQPNPGFAAQALRCAAGNISQPSYPRVGEHCLICPTRECRIAYQKFPA